MVNEMLHISKCEGHNNRKVGNADVPDSGKGINVLTKWKNTFRNLFQSVFERSQSKESKIRDERSNTGVYHDYPIDSQKRNNIQMDPHLPWLDDSMMPSLQDYFEDDKCENSGSSSLQACHPTNVKINHNGYSHSELVSSIRDQINILTKEEANSSDFINKDQAVSTCHSLVKTSSQDGQNKTKGRLENNYPQSTLKIEKISNNNEHALSCTRNGKLTSPEIVSSTCHSLVKTNSQNGENRTKGRLESNYPQSTLKIEKISNNNEHALSCTRNGKLTSPEIVSSTVPHPLETLNQMEYKITNLENDFSRKIRLEGNLKSPEKCYLSLRNATNHTCLHVCRPIRYDHAPGVSDVNADINVATSKILRLSLNGRKVITTTHLIADDFVYRLCSNDYKTLVQCRNRKSAKNNANDVILRPTSTTYKSAADYINTYGNALYVETVESVSESCAKGGTTFVATWLCAANEKPERIPDSRFHSVSLKYSVSVSCFNENEFPLINSLICIIYKQRHHLAFVYGFSSRPTLDFGTTLKGPPERIACSLVLDVMMIEPVFNNGLFTSSSIKVGFICRLGAVYKMYMSLSDIGISPFLKFLLKPDISGTYKREGSNRPTLVKALLNKEQKEAVSIISDAILNSRDTIIKMVHGPPGTGKTQTIASLIAQMCKERKRSSPIMVCAPSNAAADELALRIGESKKSNVPVTVVRMGIESKMRKEVIPYCLNRQLTFKEQVDYLNRCDVIVSTLSSCYSKLTSGLSFCCCIIDEASQCHEPEALITFLLHFSKLVLIGDQNQLSATVTNHRALSHGLKTSMFERFYKYAEGNDDFSGIHQLKRQYRMHKDVACWPSKQFYEDTLITPAEVTKKNSYLVKPYIIFDLKYSIEEKMDFGLFNKREAEFIKCLYDVLLKHIKGMTIGIITPYNKQKELLKDIFRDPDITISTVDMFQGQERDIIIFSSVRSNNRHEIGFLKDACRLNVALTRAKKSCFVVGNQYTLRSNNVWRSLIKNAYERNVICSVTANTNHLKTFLSKKILRSY